VLGLDLDTFILELNWGTSAGTGTDYLSKIYIELP